MGKRSPTGVLVAAVIWIVIALALASAYKLIFKPRQSAELERSTGGESQYKHDFRVALDSFSGYCVLRSDDFRRRLKGTGVRLDLEDDGADYSKRIKALRDGKVDAATFTIDSFLSVAAELGSFPGTIVLVLDETAGADAMVSYTSGVSTLADLNSADARVVLTPDSPSEFLARVAVAHFDMPLLSRKWAVAKDGSEEVFHALRTADPHEKHAYVLWEPFVSQAMKLDGVQVLLDSSKLRGYIVDVLVVQRDYLQKNPGVVSEVVEAYLRSAYSLQQGRGMADAVLRDSAKTGTRGIGRAESERMAKTIHWKNTLENYAHFGLLSGSESAGIQHIEDMIDQIVGVLVKTGDLDKNPVAGKSNTLFYSGALADLKNKDFHPGKALNLLEGVGAGQEGLTAVRSQRTLPALSESGWDRLNRVGQMRIEPLSFGRGSSRLHLSAQRNLDSLVTQLKSFPEYYLTVVGHARPEGDREANLRLAEARAEAAAEYLIEKGLHQNRVRSKAAAPSVQGGQAQSVRFEVAQQPY